jgi:putative ABC transport system permease protein
VLQNYLVTAARHFVRHRLYAFINIAGLAVGLACTILIALFVRDELSYDQWIPDSANLYRVELNIAMPGRPLMKLADSPFPLPRAMREQIPEVKAMTRLVTEAMVVAIGDRQFSETVDVVDQNFFQVIELPFVAGDPGTVLAQPESAVLSQSAARKYFGDADPIGKSITVTGGSDAAKGPAAFHPLIITGVVRDLPHNTQLAGDIFIPNSSQADEMPQSIKENWWDEQGFGYVLLAPDTSSQAVISKMNTIIDQNVDPKKDAGWKLRGSEVEQAQLTPFHEVHLTSDRNIGGGMRPAGSLATVYGFSVIALLILLVACFNFMNLATARAMLRAREISLRKAVGATRRQLIIQFLGEAVMTALVALVFALALVEVLLPAYDQFLDRPITFHYLSDWQLFLGLIATAIAAGLVSGTYPALVLSRFQPAAVLKSNTSGQAGSGLTRLVLVVLQFSVSIGLGIAVIVVFRQIDFARRSDLGFNRDGIVVIFGGEKLTAAARESFWHALSDNPAVAGVSQSSAVPFELSYSNAKIQISGNSEVFVFRMMDMSPEFPDVYEMKLLAGRQLSRSHGEDELLVNPFTPGLPNQLQGVTQRRNILINAQAARRLGWTPAEAIGRTILFNDMSVEIVGVLADPKIDGVREAVLPMVYGYHPEGNSVISVRIQGAAVSAALSHIDRTWRAYVPTAPIQRYFLNDSFDNLFKADEKQGTMFSVFVCIAIIIACLGLFGVAAFTAERRTKEIGLRKVFGARARDIVRLLLWQFSIPVLIANVIAWPVAYYYLHRWLEGYAYRITLNPLYFLAAGVIALTIAWVTIISHAVRIARASPILALRYE